MPIVWTTLARIDLERHFAFNAARDRAMAQRVDGAVIDAISRLSELPHRGRPGILPETRELVIPSYPYVAVYTVRDTRIIILRIWDAREDWK